MKVHIVTVKVECKAKEAAKCSAAKCKAKEAAIFFISTTFPKLSNRGGVGCFYAKMSARLKKLQKKL